MRYSLKKYSAFFLGPIAAMLFVIVVFQGSYILQSIDSLTSLSQAFVSCSECLLTLGPATILAIIIGFPVFYLLRWIIHWKLWSCLLGALLVVGSVSLLIMNNVANAGIKEILAGQYLLAIALATVSYGTVFWFLMDRYWKDDPDEE
ncbi:MAG: hypothetical protein ABFS24_09820 [Pseudomonadota bacterium]